MDRDSLIIFNGRDEKCLEKILIILFKIIILDKYVNHRYIEYSGGMTDKKMFKFQTILFQLKNLGEKSK